MTLLRIGDLARLGGVSVRMLRHYHEVGLLLPGHIAEATGYRSYDTEQLDRLRQIVRLKNIGLSLAQVAEVLDDKHSIAELRTVLLERRAAIEADIEAAHASLADLDQHLAELAAPPRQKETPMPTAETIEVVVKPVAARLVAQLSAVAESFGPEHIGPVIQPLYPELTARMEAAGVAIAGPSTAWYEDTADGRVQVHATMTIAERPDADEAALGFEVVELPRIDRAATTIHRGTMDNCDDTYLPLLEWIDANGHTAVGYSRELDIECGPGNNWIVELQMELAPEAG